MKIVLLDIEGTTTSISFVYDVLFPYVRKELRAFLRDEWESPDVKAARTMLVAEGTLAADDLETVAAFADRLMDEDRKSPGLKLLQGRIAERGYRAGALRGHVFDDVVPAIRRWRAAGKRVAIYSSGSELAQRLLFSTTAAGDLTPEFDAFFDTRVGAKVEASSYAAIANALGAAPEEILFVSDSLAELRAARAAGLATTLAVRPGNAPVTNREGHATIDSFEKIKSD
jgi:enolase-phosphatase E1